MFLFTYFSCKFHLRWCVPTVSPIRPHFGALERTMLAEGWSGSICAEAVKQKRVHLSDVGVGWRKYWNGCHIATNEPILQSADGGLTGSMLCSNHIPAFSSSSLASRGVPQHLPGCSTGPPVVQHFMGSFHLHSSLLACLCRQLKHWRKDGCEGSGAAPSEESHATPPK